MRIGVVLAATLAVLAAAAASPASGRDRGLSRPPAKLSEAGKTIWMGEWVACWHDTLPVLAREIGIRIRAGRSLQATAVMIATKAETPLYMIDSELRTAIDGCRNGILWRFYHPAPPPQRTVR